MLERVRSTGITADAVLCDVAIAQADQVRAAARLLRAAADWADLHPGLDPEWLAHASPSGDGAELPLAGEGAPAVDARCVAEFGAAMGRSTEAAQRLIGDAIELRARLPRLWRRVMALRVPAWEARAVAQLTRALSTSAADFVDRQLAVFPRLAAGRVERLVDAAVARFMPDLAELQRQQAADRRRVDIAPCQIEGPVDGLAAITGLLDLADAVDLDRALTERAITLGRLGVDGSEQVRRSVALGDLARGTQDTLEFATANPVAPSTIRPAADDAKRAIPGRTIVLNVHLSEAALSGASEIAWLSPHSSGRTPLLDRPVLSGQVREWCGRPETRVIVRPILDLAEALTAPGYQVPDRIRDHLQQRDDHCVFPHCRARRTDADHIEPYDHEDPGLGGATTTDNLALLCRRHHRLKTHTRWRYRPIRPGLYWWTSPYGRHYLRDELTTYPLELSRRE